jgi:methyl-accepting chemotaxis protein
MADVENMTVEILKQIRDEIRTTRTELSSRIDQTNQRLDQTNQRLDLVEDTVKEMATQTVFLVKHARPSPKHSRLVEREIDELKERVSRLEQGHKPTS